MRPTNAVSAPRKQVSALSAIVALGVLLFAVPAFAAKPPAASSVTVYNCLVAPTTPVSCGSESCAGHLHVTFSSYNSNDPVRTIAYDTSAYLNSRSSSTASPTSVTLSCATSDGCVIKGAAEACGSGGVNNDNCGLDAESTTVRQAIELSRSGFNLVFRVWTGVCGPQVCSGC